MGFIIGTFWEHDLKTNSYWLFKTKFRIVPKIEKGKLKIWIVGFVDLAFFKNSNHYWI